jgi:hypothetical protein
MQNTESLKKERGGMYTTVNVAGPLAIDMVDGSEFGASKSLSRISHTWGEDCPGMAGGLELMVM